MKSSLLNQYDSTIVETFIFGSNGHNDAEIALITESAIEYIITTKIFIAQLL